MLSEALALTVMAPASMAPAAGDTIPTVGGVVSLNTVTVTGSDVQRGAEHVSRDRPERMRSVAGGHRVPGDRIGRGGVFGAEVDAVQRELDALDGERADHADAGA